MTRDARRRVEEVRAAVRRRLKTEPPATPALDFVRAAVALGTAIAASAATTAGQVTPESDPE